MVSAVDRILEGQCHAEFVSQPATVLIPCLIDRVVTLLSAERARKMHQYLVAEYGNIVHHIERCSTSNH